MIGRSASAMVQRLDPLERDAVAVVFEHENAVLGDGEFGDFGAVEGGG